MYKMKARMTIKSPGKEETVISNEKFVEVKGMLDEAAEYAVTRTMSRMAAELGEFLVDGIKDGSLSMYSDVGTLPRFYFKYGKTLDEINEKEYTPPLSYEACLQRILEDMWSKERWER